MKGLIYLLFGVAAIFDMSAKGEFVIAENLKAKVPIVISENAPASTVYAAEELSKYLTLITGAKFEIRNSVPDSRQSIKLGFPYEGEKKNEEIRIFIKNGSLHITGANRRAVLYAVYRLLEDFGCGFWAPDNETVPEIKRLSVASDINVSDSPAFEVRQPHGASTYRHPEWKVKIASNGDMFCSEGSLAGKFGGHRQYDISQNAAGLYGYGKKANLLAEHPEWFAWRKKKNARSGQQLCMTNLGCRNEILRRVHEIMKKEPQRRQISVSIGDGFEFCQCNSCDKLRQAEGESALSVDLANFVARSVRGFYPRLRILMFAYESTKRPPKTMKLEPNVDVCFAFIQRDYSRPPHEFKPHDELLAKWTELSGGNVYIWGYNAQFKSYLTPYPIIDQMGDEMRTYKKFGAKGVFMQMSESSLSDFIDMKSWLFSKLAWNPEQDEMALMRKWCEGACGKAAPHVYEWLCEMKRVRERVRADQKKGILLYAGDTRDYFTADDIINGRLHLEKALAAVKDDERALKQVKKIAFSLDVVSLVRYNADVEKAARKRNVALPSRQALYNAVDLLSKSYKNGSWCEGMSYKEAMLRLRHGELWPDKKGDWMTSPSVWTFKNPVVNESAQHEPSIAYDEKLKSYLMVDVRDEGLVMSRAARAVDLFYKPAETKVVYKSSSIGDVVNGELHCGRDGKWRIYVTVNTKNGPRVGILESPKSFGQYQNRGLLMSNENAYDPTILEMPNGNMYLVYATSAGKSSIVIRQMRTPNKADLKSSKIILADNDKTIFSSPAVVRKGKRMFIVYISSTGSPRDAVFNAVEHDGGNVMRDASWKTLSFRDPWGKPTKALMNSGSAFRKKQNIYSLSSLNVFSPPGSLDSWFVYQGWNMSAPVDKKKCTATLMQQFDFDKEDKLIRQAGPLLNLYVLQPGIKK